MVIKEMMALLFKKGRYLNTLTSSLLPTPGENELCVRSQGVKVKYKKKERNRRLYQVPKGRKDLSLKLRRGGKARSAFTRKRKEKKLSTKSKEGKGQAESQRGREGKNKSERSTVC